MQDWHNKLIDIWDNFFTDLEHKFYPITSLGGMYEVNRCGEVRNTKTKRILKPRYRLYDAFKKDTTRSCESLMVEVFGSSFENYANTAEFYPIPSTGGRYELNGRGELRNSFTKKYSPKLYHISELNNLKSLQSFLNEVFGKKNKIFVKSVNEFNEFKPLISQPKYEINKLGQVRNIRTKKNLSIHYRIANTVRSLPQLIKATFGVLTQKQFEDENFYLIPFDTDYEMSGKGEVRNRKSRRYLPPVYKFPDTDLSVYTLLNEVFGLNFTKYTKF